MKTVILFLLFSSAAVAQTCPITAPPSNLPETVLPSNYSSLLEVYDPGVHHFRNSDPSSNSRWVIEIKQFSNPITCNFGGPWNESSHGYQMLYCQQKPLSSDILAVYGSSQDPLTCSSGYAILNGYCALVDEVQCTANCADGFPPNVYGYEDFCDRPKPKLCGDGTHVRADIGVCQMACSDNLTCFEYARSQNPCPSNNLFEFYYVDPSNWTSSCKTIAGNSPDHTDNGGNADGNDQNDPGSTPGKTASELDPRSFAENIDKVLQDDFANVERAIREGIKKDSENTNAIIESNRGNIKSLLNSELASTEAITGQIEQSSNQIVDAINQLGGVEPGEPDPTACDPESPNYQSCITPGSAIPSNSSPTTIAQAHSKFWSDLKSAPVYLAMQNMANIVPDELGQCPKLIFDFSDMGWGVIESNFHCELIEVVRPYFQAIMMVYFAFIGFRVFAGA